MPMSLAVAGTHQPVATPWSRQSIPPLGTNDRHRRADRTWRTMPSVWWPWMGQLVVIETEPRWVDLDLVALEPARIRGTIIPPGTLFSIRIEQAAPSRFAELDTILLWAQAGTEVTILAGRAGRSAWLCLSRNHRRVVLTGVRCDIDTPASSEYSHRTTRPAAATAKPASGHPTEVRS
jgi:hypothetical protein